MACRRCVGYTINVPSVFPTNLNSDMGTGTSTSAYLTSPITTLTKSSQSGTVGIVEDATYTLPVATS